MATYAPGIYVTREGDAAVLSIERRDNDGNWYCIGSEVAVSDDQRMPGFDILAGPYPSETQAAGVLIGGWARHIWPRT